MAMKSFPCARGYRKQRPLFAFLFARPCPQIVEQTLPVIEACRLQTLESRGEIDQPAACREIEHAQRAGCTETHPTSDSDSVLIVHQYEICADRESQRNNGTLALIQLRRREIIAADVGIWLYIQPGRRLRNPCAHRCRRFGAGEFVPHRLRRQHPIEYAWQQLDIAG